MKKLQALQFIDLRAGKAGPMTYALIHNPHPILQWRYAQKTPGLVEASYSALIEKALDVGAMDMFPAPPPPPNPLSAAQVFRMLPVGTQPVVPAAPLPPTDDGSA